MGSFVAGIFGGMLVPVIAAAQTQASQLSLAETHIALQQIDRGASGLCWLNFWLPAGAS